MKNDNDDKYNVSADPPGVERVVAQYTTLHHTSLGSIYEYAFTYKIPFALVYIYTFPRRPTTTTKCM